MKEKKAVFMLPRMGGAVRVTTRECLIVKATADAGRGCYTISSKFVEGTR